MTITGAGVRSETATVGRTGATYKRVVQVEYSGGYNAAALVVSTGNALLLKYGNEHPDDGNSVVTSIDVADEDGEDPQQGVCTYTITFSPFTNEFVQNPLDRPAEIEWGGGEDQTEVMMKDHEGRAVRNSANDLYDPQPERDIPGADVTITRFEADNPADVIAAFSKSTNSASIWGQDPEGAKMGKITASLVYENNVPYWKVKYPIYFTSKQGGWRLLLVDNGHRKLQDDGSKRRINDDMGHTSPVPCLLDGSGDELEDGDDPVIYPSLDNGDDVDGFARYPKVAWAALSLPNPFA